jgi:hypothetical protein
MLLKKDRRLLGEASDIKSIRFLQLLLWHAPELERRRVRDELHIKKLVKCSTPMYTLYAVRKGRRAYLVKDMG